MELTTVLALKAQHQWMAMVPETLNPLKLYSHVILYGNRIAEYNTTPTLDSKTKIIIVPIHLSPQPFTTAAIHS